MTYPKYNICLLALVPCICVIPYYGIIRYKDMIHSIIRYKDMIHSISLYSIVVYILHTPLLHLLHMVLVLLLLFYMTDRIVVHYYKDITVQESSVVNDNVFLFLSDILLVLNLYSSDMKYSSILVFGVILCTKYIVWITTSRLEVDCNINIIHISVYTSILCSICSVYSLYSSGIGSSVYGGSIGSDVYGGSMGSSIGSSGHSSIGSSGHSSSIGSNGYSGHSNNSSNISSTTLNTIMILFAFESLVVALSSYRNIGVCTIKMCNTTHRPVYLFYIEIVYMLCLLVVYTVYIIISSIKHKIPFNVFRSALSILDKLVKKIRMFTKYTLVCSKLDDIQDVHVNMECVICSDVLTVGKKLICGHCYHIDCLKQWCERQVFCPICKIDILQDIQTEFMIDGDDVVAGVPVAIDE